MTKRPGSSGSGGNGEKIEIRAGPGIRAEMGEMPRSLPRIETEEMPGIVRKRMMEIQTRSSAGAEAGAGTKSALSGYFRKSSAKGWICGSGSMDILSG